MLRRCAIALMMSACLVPTARAAEEPVPIDQEPRHRLKFENAHVRFFDVQLEPGYQSLYHWHHNDGVFVTRLILHPGESTELYAPCGILVSASGGRVAYDAPGGGEKIAMDRGAFKWRKLQQTVKLTNVGANVFHGLDIRIK